MSRFMSEVDSLSQLLSESRDRVMSSGDYEASIADHDQVLRTCSKLQRSCDAASSKKLEGLKERCKNEIALLQQIVIEINGLKKPLALAGHKKLHSEAKEEEDPDVWPPPTPNPSSRMAARGGGGGDDNLPSWANNNALQPSFPSRPEPARRREPTPSRGNGDVPAGRRR
jgi:hypothetical protein